MSYAKKYIKSWLLENNPVFDTSEPTIDFIYSNIEDQLENLENTAIRIVLSQYLSINYSNNLLEVVDDYLVSTHEEVALDWRSLGIYNSQLACIVKTIILSEVIPDNTNDNYDIDLLSPIIEEYVVEYQAEY